MLPKCNINVTQKLLTLENVYDKFKTYIKYVLFFYGKEELQMKKFLIGILVLFVIMILPFLVASFLEKHIILFIILLVAELIWIGKEICE
jgi:hypothetical protein